jgi:hypothetical protein
VRTSERSSPAFAGSADHDRNALRQSQRDQRRHSHEITATVMVASAPKPYRIRITGSAQASGLIQVNSSTE